MQTRFPRFHCRLIRPLFRLLNRFLNRRLIRLLIGLLATSLATQSVHATEPPQCFADPQQAYQYVLEQQRLAQLAKNNVPININTASEAELTTLAGISSKKAKAIIAYRKAFGDFASVDDLAKVHGIGKKTVNKNRTRLEVD